MRIRQILVAAMLGLVCTLPCAARPVILVRSDLWCPYNCNPDSDYPGYAIEIARIVFGEAGYDVDYQLLNWTRSIDEARQGQADAVVGAYDTDVPGFVIPQEPIGHSSAGFAVRRGVPFHYVDEHSLDGRVLGIVATYEFAGPLGDYLHALRLDHSRIQFMSGDGALSKNLLKLMAARLDIVIDDWNVLAHAIDEMQMGAGVSLSQDHGRVPVYIAFSPANPLSRHYADILTDGIRRLRISGRLATILARYGVADWH